MPLPAARPGERKTWSTQTLALGAHGSRKVETAACPSADEGQTERGPSTRWDVTSEASIQATVWTGLETLSTESSRPQNTTYPVIPLT